jgi:hypothetical protein
MSASLLDQPQIIQASYDTANTSLRVSDIGNWSVYHVPATATQATITKAAVSGYRHVCNSITATVAANSTAQTPLTVYLRDGATGAGTILWAGTVAAPANGLGGVCVGGLNIIGSENTAMTLEFSAAGVANSAQAVTLTGFEVLA